MYLPAGFVRATEDLVLIDWRGYQFLIPLVRPSPISVEPDSGLSVRNVGIEPGSFTRPALCVVSAVACCIHRPGKAGWIVHGRVQCKYVENSEVREHYLRRFQADRPA